MHHSAEGQSLPQGSSQHDAHRPGVGTRRMGSSARGEHSGTLTHAAQDARDRECDAAGSCSSEGASRRTTVIQSEPDETLMPVQPLLLTDLCGTWQQLSRDNPLDPVIDQDDVGENIFYSRTTNWIAKEMWQYFASKGVLPESPLLKTHRADVFEIYCSPESQLTQQARAQGCGLSVTACRTVTWSPSRGDSAFMRGCSDCVRNMCGCLQSAKPGAVGMNSIVTRLPNLPEGSCWTGKKTKYTWCCAMPFLNFSDTGIHPIMHTWSNR